MLRWTDSDGEIDAEFVIEDGKIYRRMRTKNAQGVLQRNKELQRNPGAIKPLDWAGVELTIPTAEYHKLIERYPDLNSPDGEIQTRAWLKVMGHPASDRWRQKERKRQGAITGIGGGPTVGL